MARKPRRKNPTPSIVASRSDFTKKTPILPIALGAAAVGGIAYLMLRPSTSQAAPMPQLGAGSQPPVTRLTPPGASGYFPSSTNASVGITSGPNGPDPSPSLVARLRGSPTAQQIFALQALAYSYRYTDAIPDGIEGPITDGILTSTVGASRFSPSLYPAVRQAILSQPSASEFAARNLPFTLPSDLIASIGQVAASMDPSTPQLAVLPQDMSPAPAGQVMPFAGYSRIPSVSPGNTVGQNPGYGVITDPSGLNIGLWQFYTSRYAPSGNIAADLGRNPIAGQDGGYFQGYPGVDAMRRMGR